jgi:hypothetical protein
VRCHWKELKGASLPFADNMKLWQLPALSGQSPMEDMFAKLQSSPLARSGVFVQDNRAFDQDQYGR